MKFDLHQRIALWWVLVAPFAFAPALASSHLPQAGRLLGEGVIVMTVCIAACPLMLRWSTFKRLFCWTDALSLSQREALAKRNLRQYYRAASDTGYVGRVKPYMFRIMVFCAALMVVGQFVNQEDIKIGLLFSSMYVVSVLFACIASVPMSAITARRS